MDWKAILSQKGYRLSEPRKRIMELLEKAEVALSPQQIHQELQQKAYELGLVSVYRTLELLTRLELVSVVYDPQLNPGYRLSTTGHHHHIVCQECHKAWNFPAPMILTSWSSAWKPKPLSRFAITYCNFLGSALIVSSKTTKEKKFEKIIADPAGFFTGSQCLQHPNKQPSFPG